MAGLIAAIQADQDYPANLGSNNNGVGGDNGAADDLRFTVALSGTGQGIVFTPQGTPRNPDSGMAMFSAKRTSSSSSRLADLPLRELHMQPKLLPCANQAACVVWHGVRAV